MNRYLEAILLSVGALLTLTCISIVLTAILVPDASVLQKQVYICGMWSGTAIGSLIFRWVKERPE